MCVCACLCMSGYTYVYIHLYIWIYKDIYIYIYAIVYLHICIKESVYMSKYARYLSMSGLSCMQHDPNILLASKRFFFRWFAHGLVKPTGNSTKWTQSAVKRKAFENGAKSMVTESAIRAIEIARCLFSKQTKTAGPQWTTLPCFTAGSCQRTDERLESTWHVINTGVTGDMTCWPAKMTDTWLVFAWFHPRLNQSKRRQKVISNRLWIQIIWAVNWSKGILFIIWLHRFAKGRTQTFGFNGLWPLFVVSSEPANEPHAKKTQQLK